MYSISKYRPTIGVIANKETFVECTTPKRKDLRHGRQPKHELAMLLPIGPLLYQIQAAAR